MAETAPGALEDESSFYSLFLFSLLSALIDVKEEDQRLLNSSTQEDGEIEREGGEWRRRRDGGWRSKGGTDREVQGSAVCQSAPRNDPLTTGLNQTLRPAESKRIHSFSFSLTFTSLPLLSPSLSPLSFLLYVPS